MQVKPRLWSATDVSEYLGVAVQTLYDWRCKGYGPRGKRVGKYLRYDPAEVQRWFDELSDAA